MDKLLHERLRDVKDDSETIKVSPGLKVLMSKKFCNELAHEIERYYIPRPRFEDGEPVKKGSKTDVCDVWSFDISSDGYWRLYDDDGVEFDYGEDGEFVKRPTPKVYDADGVEIKVGQEVYDIDKEGNRYIVLIPYDDSIDANFTVKCRDLNMGGIEFHCLPSQLTHEKPVFDADGKRIKVGDIVYNLENDGERGTVRCFYSYGVGVEWDGGWRSDGVNPQYLTHEKPVFDAEGVRICNGDTVWGTLLGDKHEVSLVKNGCVYLDDGSICFEPNQLTHREPDSLEKLRDDLKSELDRTWFGEDKRHMSKYVDRLTAIIERG